MQRIRRFESPEDYADFLRRIPSHLEPQYDYSFGGLPLQAGCDVLLRGDTTRLDEAQALIDKLSLEINTEGMPMLVPTIAGFIPNVPSVIAGHPEGMFRRSVVDSPSPQSPLTVYIETTVSAGVSQQHLINRGVATLAFVLAMEVIRPVDLYVVQALSHSKRPGVYSVVTKVASRPMDLARAVWMLTDPTYARRFLHTMANHLSETNRQCDIGPWAFDAPSDKDYEKNVRKLLDMEPDDIFIKGGYLTDTLMLNNPVQWVRSMVEKHSAERAE